MRGVEQIPWLYDAILWVAEKRGLESWREWLVGGARGRVLDLGCGTGRNLPLYSKNTTPIGLDLSADGLRRARRRAPGVPLVRARAEALPFRDAAFDTVVSGLVLCSVTSQPGALAELRRVLKPGSQVRFLEHVRSASPFWARVQDRLQPAWTWVAGGCHPNRATERAVEAAGFAIEPEGRRAEGTMRRFTARVSAG